MFAISGNVFPCNRKSQIFKYKAAENISCGEIELPSWPGPEALSAAESHPTLDSSGEYYSAEVVVSDEQEEATMDGMGLKRAPTHPRFGLTERERKPNVEPLVRLYSQ